MSTLPFQRQLIIDIFIFLLFCLPLVVLHALGQPTVTGFWCDDPSLTFPYKPDTVSMPMLMAMTLCVPLFVMAVSESVRAVFSARQTRQIRSEMLSLGKAYSIFLFGLVATCIFTEVLKFSVGRLRPHFFDICKPDFDRVNCTSDRGSQRYIQTYTCTNTLVDDKLIRDSHMSFPSGHASMSVFSALFTVFYLQMRMGVTLSHLLRPALQMGLLLLAVMCCVTRVTDYKHFTSDVIAGAAIGFCLAWVTFYRVGHAVIPTQISEKPPRLARATSIESEPHTPTPLLRPERLIISYRNHTGPGGKHDFVHNV